MNPTQKQFSLNCVAFRKQIPISMTLGFVENSGLISAIQFKRSVIENKKIDEQHAAYVCDLTQHLIEAKFRSLRTP